MLIYLLAFGVSAILLYFADKQKKRINHNILIFFAILLPALLAGLRDSRIGTDVEVYIIRHFQNALYIDSFGLYFAQSMSGEVLYHVLIYVCAHIIPDYHTALFMLSILTITITYIAFARMSKIFGTPIWLGMLLYYLFLYNISLNIMRQCVAVSFVFLATTYLFEKNYKKFFLFSIIAFLFHGSGIISLAFLPMYLLTKQGRTIDVGRQIFQILAFLIGLIFLIIVGQRLVLLLVSHGLLRENYLNYLAGGVYSNSSKGISWLSVGMFLGYLIITLCHWKILSKRKLETLFFIISIFVLVITTFGSVIATYVSRLGYFFMPFTAVGLANMMQCYSKKSKGIYTIIIIGYAVFVWFIIFVYRGNHETIPYIFGI